MLRQAGPWGFGVTLQVPPRPGPERPPRKGSEQGTAPKSPSQPRPSSHVLGQSQSWGLGVQVSARNLPEISQPFAGISQKAQEMPRVPSGPQGSGVGGGSGVAAGVAVLPETSGPESTDSCAHFSYFKPLAPGGTHHTHNALQPDIAAPGQGGSPECGAAGPGWIVKEREFHFLSSRFVPDTALVVSARHVL